MRITGPHLLPRQLYPLEARAYRADSDELVWSREVEAPHGFGVLEVPPLAAIHGCPIRIEIRFADGTVLGGDGEPVEDRRRCAWAPDL